MKSWKGICTLSVVHFMAFPEMQTGEGDFAASLRQIGGRNFFDAVEMGLINDPAIRETVKNTARELDLIVGFGAQPLILGQNLNINDLNDDFRAYSIEKIKEGIEQAHEINADRFVVLSGKDPGDDLREAAYRVLEESLVELGEFARPFGMRLVLETFDRKIDKKALVGPSDEAGVLAQRVQSRYAEFGLLYDMGHMPLLDETPAQGLSLLSDMLAEVHLGSCVLTPGLEGYGDKHPRFGYPGGVNGTGELVEFLHELFRTGYLKKTALSGDPPWIGFEIRPMKGETTPQILDNIERTWVEAWSIIEKTPENLLTGRDEDRRN